MTLEPKEQIISLQKITTATVQAKGKKDHKHRVINGKHD